MPQGIQVFNAAGQALLDTSNRVLKSVLVETVTETGVDVIPYSGVDGSSSILAVPLSDDQDAPFPDSITVGGGNVTVTWGDDARGSGFTRSILVMEY